jgi:hypothetical protein
MGTRPVADSQPRRPMSIKLGIWCDYGITLEPSEGIGVFVANLVQGLIEQPSIERIVLVSKEGQESLLDPLKQLNPDLVQVVGCLHRICSSGWGALPIASSNIVLI